MHEIQVYAYLTPLSECYVGSINILTYCIEATSHQNIIETFQATSQEGATIKEIKSYYC
jgi:hypothetical protein